MRLRALCGRPRKSTACRRWGVRLVYGDVTDPRQSAGGGGRTASRLSSGRLHPGAEPSAVLRGELSRGGPHRAGVRRCRIARPILIHVSSQAAAGPAVEGRPRVESDPAAPVSQYGRTKRLGECAAERFAHRVPITIVRPPMVLGEGDRLGLSLFRSVVRFHVHLTPGVRPQRFSLIHADDLVHLLILAAERGRRLPPGQGQQPPGLPRAITSPPASKIRPMPTWAAWWPKSVGRRVLVIPTAMPVVRLLAAMGEAISHVRHQPPVHKPRQGPRNCRRLLALFGPGGPRRVGLRRGRPADRAAAANDRMVLS